eukprot:gene8518-11515_t
MMLNSVFWLTILLLLQICSSRSSVNKRYPEKKLEAKRPQPLKLNTEGLPTITQILSDLDLDKYLPNFIRMGVTETRLLLRLTNMDFRIMSIEWENFTEEDGKRLKDVINKMIIQATVVEEAAKPDFSERNKLSYGRVYLEDSVQSYEFVTASYGGAPPIGKVSFIVSSPLDGCDNTTSYNYTNNILLVERGNCTFLEKSILAKKNGAIGLIIANNEDRLDSPSSGLGVDKNISEKTVLSLDNFPTLSLSNTSLPKLLFASKFNQNLSTFINIVPLKCGSGGICKPVIQEERSLLPEVTWGTIRIKSTTNETKSFEFLTSNFGCQLPSSSLTPAILADPIDACSPIRENGTLGAILVVYRGKCRFDTKALHAQQAGARMMLIIDIEDNALQRVGGMNPDVGHVGIPSVIVTSVAGKFIVSHLSQNINLTASLIPAKDTIGSDEWINVSITQWNEEESDKIAQLEGLVQKYSQNNHNEIVSWLRRRINELSKRKFKSVETDENLMIDELVVNA